MRRLALTMMLGMAVIATAVILLASQTLPVQKVSFEVASVKLQPWTGQGGVYVLVRGNTLDAEHASLNELVAFAYNLRDVQLSGGPGWADRSHAKLMDAELYQVTAKAAGDPPPPTEVFRQMLQTLLAERFQLKVHHVQKDLPTYNLIVNKDGPKIKESRADVKFSSVTSARGRFGTRMVTTKMTMQQLVNTLSLYASRPVLDKTGLTGSYDFTLEFVGENVAAEQDAAADGPSLFTAIQEQLGLKLESSTAPFDTVVIDSVQHPTEN
jgi:uncharacterized protein (TIGR03435 family)